MFLKNMILLLYFSILFCLTLNMIIYTNFNPDLNLSFLFFYFCLESFFINIFNMILGNNKNYFKVVLLFITFHLITSLLGLVLGMLICTYLNSSMSLFTLILHSILGILVARVFSIVFL